MLTADLRECQLQLAATGGEAKGLLTANEMAEQACMVLRNELFLERGAHQKLQLEIKQERVNNLEQELSRLGAELTAAHDLARKSEARLVNTLTSHSWRVTAPLRRISRMLYRRP
jgi:hypothetical protein